MNSRTPNCKWSVSLWGEPKHAERYCGKLAPSITCLTNETTMPYETYGLQQGKLGELMSPAVVVASVRALARGSSQGGKPLAMSKCCPALSL
jgi:hypothetical protein